MNGFLLDTNHLSESLRPVSRVRDRIGHLRRLGVRVGTCVPVLCELAAAFPPDNRREVYRRALRRLLGRIRVWPLEGEIAESYGEIYQDLRARGRILSQVDMILAALVRQMDLTLATTDLDFAALPDIRTENWLQQESRPS
jgi:tRNA(fMet)-specific endonuclease VapC